MQWIGFQHTELGISFAPMRPLATVGAAEASMIRLKSKTMPAVHGQFVMEGGEISYRSFLDRQIIALSKDVEIQIQNWTVFCLEELEIWERFSEPILTSFRDLLKKAENQNIESIFMELRERWFFGKTMPFDIESRLRQELGDISLSSPIEFLLSREEVTDILISSHDEIWVEEKGQLDRSALRFSSAETYRVYIENLLARIEKTIDHDTPFVDFILPDGSRGHLIGPPVAENTYHLSIRKIRKNYFKLVDLLNLEMFSREIFDEISRAISKKLNILICGATGSGKTTLARAILNEISLDQRILVIEDTPELNLPRANTVFLCSRVDSLQQARSIDLRQLVKQSLRMRPDRIVVGEVRGEEAMDLLHAMNTGHRGCIGSLHANSARDALDRLQGLVQMSNARLTESAIRELIARNIHLVIHCEKTAEGRRKIHHIAFVRGIDQDHILLEVRQ